jgi:glycosyltransferase involved in cell wall biosynthesis
MGMELTILMPCLNEAETLGICISKAKQYIKASGISAEILIADNGSSDGSQEIAQNAGVTVTAVSERGYGAALRSGIAIAKGKYIIMADADDSYDFSRLDGLVEKLREGYQLVIGNRFKGGIDKGAMPFLHRYLGNPVLSFIGRLFFKTPVGDFHCGLRGIDRQAFLALDLRTTGMEFASEMVVRSVLAKYRIAEVPIRLSQDGRSGKPHLRSWRDGWRHLRFLLIYSPKWLFVIPGLVILFTGLFGSVALLPGPVSLGGVGLDIHTFIVACFATLTGTQFLTVAAIASKLGEKAGLLPRTKLFSSLLDSINLDRILIASGIIAVCSFVGVGWCVGQWIAVDFGPLVYASLVPLLLLSATGVALSLQLATLAFLGGVIDVATDSDLLKRKVTSESKVQTET